MEYKILQLSALLLLVLTGLNAQESVNVTGGNALGSGGSVSYSVGQVSYQTYIGSNGSVAEGVNQAYEVSVVTGIKEYKDLNISVSAYPNPTKDHLTLIIDEFELSNLFYQLYDMNGKLLQSERITRNQTSIAMINLAPATYFLKVIIDQREVKIFKIIKN